MKLISENKPFRLDVKRFYFPAKIECDCPICWQKVFTDLNDDYISYPTLNSTSDVYMICEHLDTDKEDSDSWEKYVQIKIDLNVSLTGEVRDA